MKPILLTLLLSTLAAPAMAHNMPSSASDTGIFAPSVNEFGRRSGNCPNRPEEPLLDTKSVMRWDYRSCGGV